jgi:hypothetical protein
MGNIGLVCDLIATDNRKRYHRLLRSFIRYSSDFSGKEIQGRKKINKQKTKRRKTELHAEILPLNYS